jgi:oligopeptide/dipeptide ABC transporter ATP-binding protein
MTAPLLTVKGLVKHFPQGGTKLLQRERSVLKAVDGVSFTMDHGTTLGLVGESGCGKSTTARLILRLIEPTAGEVLLEGRDILGVSDQEMLALRRQMQLVFQDPLSSLNPRMSVGTNIAEPLRFHRLGDGRQRRTQAEAMLETVGLKLHDYDRYPHEFSGGQCQRVAIARALILRPKLVLFDEPVSALDVSIQAQILRLLLQLQEELKLSYIFISHDLSVVKRICDRIAVMYLGQIVENADSETLYRDPRHPYTRALLSAIPRPDPKATSIDDLPGLEGDVPSAVNPPSGCRFHTRCAHRMPICSERMPEFRTLGPGHASACFLYQDQEATPETETTAAS